MTNEELAALILPWCKATHPDKYQQTLAVSANPSAFRRYMIRLVEIRWSSDTDVAWRDQVPVSVLEESGLTVKMQHRPTGEMIEVKGRLAPKPRTWTFAELTATPEQFLLLLAAKKTLDLEIVEDAPGAATLKTFTAPK